MVNEWNGMGVNVWIYVDGGGSLPFSPWADNAESSSNGDGGKRGRGGGCKWMVGKEEGIVCCEIAVVEKMDER
jgi:hypothetical protein